MPPRACVETSDPGCLTAETPSSNGLRHPRASVFGEWAAADVRPYAASKEQQSKTHSEYLRNSKLRIDSQFLCRQSVPGAYEQKQIFLDTGDCHEQLR